MESPTNFVYVTHLGRNASM